MRGSPGPANLKRIRNEVPFDKIDNEPRSKRSLNLGPTSDMFNSYFDSHYSVSRPPIKSDL